MEYLELEQNRSQKTIANYDHYLTRLLDFAGDIRVSDIDVELIRKWRLWLNRLGTNTSDELGKTTQNYHLIALRSFLKYCARRDIPALAADKVELAKTVRPRVTFLNEEELERLFAEPKTNTLPGLRDRAILELLFSSGLRVSELVGLDREHINLKRREFMVRGKGQKDRPIFISQEAANWIEQYLDKRTDTARPLFVRYSGQKSVDLSGNFHRLTARSVQRLVARYALLAGITKHVSPHTLRHCLHPATRISLPRGVLSAQAVFEQQAVQQVKSYAWEKGWQTARPISAKRQHVTAELITIQAGGYELVCTPEHRLFTVGRDGINQIMAKDLAIGDYVAGVRKLSLRPKRYLPADTWRLFGYIVGDGTVSRRRRGVFLHDKNPAFLEYYQQLIADGFGKQAPIRPAPASNSYILSCYHMPLVKLLEKYGLDGTTHQIRVPARLFSSSEADIAAFLAGIYDADGNEGSAPRFFSSNLEFLKDVQMLLLRLGIDAHLYHRQRRVRLPNKSEYRNYLIHYLQILSMSDQLRFQELVPTLKKTVAEPREVGHKIPVGPMLAALTELGKRRGKHLYSRRADQQSLKYPSRYISGTIVPTGPTVMKFYNRFKRMGLTDDPRLELLRRLATSNHQLKWLRVSKLTTRQERCPVYDFTVPETEN
ncbi:MAG TPA: tyrosine-type recombinase/integrase, partial [Patescibacteria group bacterium]|nr:tyrosine-type recombinase/integrase [Patescibacteria group bacterium]